MINKIESKLYNNLVQSYMETAEYIYLQTQKAPSGKSQEGKYWPKTAVKKVMRNTITMTRKQNELTTEQFERLESLDKLCDNLFRNALQNRWAENL